MKYQLKNRELQAKIEAIDPEFGERLSLRFGRWEGDKYALLLPCEGVAITLKISDSAIEEEPEYDPSKWNKWPEVLPPKNGFYRVEYKEDNLTKKAAWMWDGLVWNIKPGIFFILGSASNEVRFKPWDDQEPDEDDEEEE